MKLLSELLALNEDWGSSDWYPIMQAMDKANKAGKGMLDTVEELGEQYYKDMGYESADDAAHAILAKWQRHLKTKKD